MDLKPAKATNVQNHNAAATPVAPRVQLNRGLSRDAAHSAGTRSRAEIVARLTRHEKKASKSRLADITQMVDEIADEFTSAPIQGFVPILVEHLVRERMASTEPVTHIPSPGPASPPVTPSHQPTS